MHSLDEANVCGSRGGDSIGAGVQTPSLSEVPTPASAAQFLFTGPDTLL